MFYCSNPVGQEKEAEAAAPAFLLLRWAQSWAGL